ncbi:hypothetical protein CLV33_10429 [Jejuia pallidilutea]|uniref:Uncharacterized protein n=1 Tax=Jejuia pallidilutea TaxID=504487 RepID=A0A362X3L6_9FLAO|nr:hypothetical protein CLV33_10429 [Jejuia pallidilutea]
MKELFIEIVKILREIIIVVFKAITKINNPQF